MTAQDKRKEIEFFDNLAKDQAYNVFSDEANDKIIANVLQLANPNKDDRILDLGCGSGIFTQLLRDKGYEPMGLDLSQELLRRGHQQAKAIDFICADAEALPFADNTLDVVMLSCLVHHLPSPHLTAREVFRVLKPNGRFVAFDPNRLNPFMYLYRDRSSPFYSPKGVTPNERPVLPGVVRRIFADSGFKSHSHFVDGLSYRYVASTAARGFLPIYNFFDRYCFKPFWMKPLSAFVFTYGMKPAG